MEALLGTEFEVSFINKDTARNSDDYNSQPPTRKPRNGSTSKAKGRARPTSRRDRRKYPGSRNPRRLYHHWSAGPKPSTLQQARPEGPLPTPLIMIEVEPRHMDVDVSHYAAYIARQYKTWSEEADGTYAFMGMGPLY
ncbi:hypothetical protein G5I_03818 [Acromyrmex echinatior]|uniref:Uncharacterized protein n=1 Tax=Acromyrmex echinatior TaxID=103372 RepID=F4WDZ2_ACREC|nr:hypothetical protein G5I_03818 [Acromyrmex echinatior]